MNDSDPSIRKLVTDPLLCRPNRGHGFRFVAVDRGEHLMARAIQDSGHDVQDLGLVVGNENLQGLPPWLPPVATVGDLWFPQYLSPPSVA